VQLSILALNLIYAALGVVLMYVSYRLIDRLTPQVDFPEELKRGNIAVAIFIAALFLSIALIVGRAIG
jgi:putative membrane protein